MKEIFEQGEFSRYKVDSLSKSKGKISITESFYIDNKVSVFISHKHDDLEDLKGIIGFIEKNFDVDVYIDSRDSSMPGITSAETARIIRERIRQCDRFILLATDGAIASKWCNWELGFADATKGKEVVLFPVQKKGIDYEGKEYLKIYSHIVYFDKRTKCKSGKVLESGYYVMTEIDNKKNITLFSDWLRSR